MLVGLRRLPHALATDSAVAQFRLVLGIAKGKAGWSVYARPEECRPARPLPQKARNYPNLCLLSSPQEYPCGIRTRVTKRLSLSFCSEALAPASAFSLAALDRPQLFLCRLWHQPQLFLWRLWHIGLSFFLAGCTFCDKESRFVSNLSPVARVSSNLCCFSPFRTSFCI